MPAPIWMNNPAINAENMVSWDDVVSVDTTSPAFQQTGSATLILGININGELIGATSNLVSPFGLYSLPIPGISGDATGTKVLSWCTNNEYFSFAGRDYLHQQQVGSIKPGETALYASGSQARLLMKLDGSINLYTQASSGATAMGLFVSPSTDSIQMINAAGNGIQISNGSGGNINGTTLFAASGGSAKASMQLLSSGAINLTSTAMLQMDGTSIALGSQVAPITNVVCINPTEIVLVLTEVAAALTSIGSAITSGNLAAVTSGAFAATGAAITTLAGTITTQVGAMLPLISSQKVLCQ